MAKGPATPQLTPVQQDALKGLMGLGIAKARATDLVLHARGATLQDIMNSALRMHGTAPRPSNVPPPLPPMPPPLPPQYQRPQGARLQAVGGTPVPPIGQTPPPLPPIGPKPPPLPQQQIPGYGPPGGPQAAPNAQQLAQMAQQGPVSSGPTPPPLPVVSTPPRPQAPVQAVPVPAPIKPRIRVRAAGSRVSPTEVPQAEGKAPETQQASAPAELPLVDSQAEYDKLPVGSRFRHPDGYIYRKERESGSQKMQEGGEVQGKGQQQPKGPWEAGWEPTYEATEGQDTDTVPAKLTPGEYVVPKPAVDQIGKENLDAITAAAQGGKLPEGPIKRPEAAESTPVGPTGEKADPTGWPALRALAYGPNSEGATAADQRQVKGAWEQPLQPGDIAVSPNLQRLYPLRSHVNVVDSKGNIILANARVADTSMYSKGNPTENTFEIWNGPSLGSGYHLVPVA